MEIVKMKLSELNPAAYNPRKALKPGDPAYEKLKASILSFGNVEPIVWNRSTGSVIGGHQRLRVLLDLGVTESEVSVVELSEVDEKRLNIALNKITGEWDDEKLTSLLADITAGGADVYPTGFDDQELASMFADLSKATTHEDNFDLTTALERAARSLLVAIFMCFLGERVIELATTRTGRTEETSGYCKAEDLANLFGLPSQSISQFTRDGVLRKEDTPAGKRYNVVRSTRAVIQHLRDKADGHKEKGTLESKKLEILEAEARIMKAKAEAAEMEAKWPI